MPGNLLSTFRSSKKRSLNPGAIPPIRAIFDVLSRLMALKALGFTDYNYFSRVFKRKTGLSPREYRFKREF
jgi:methylphosphotriester-DNA--protein-cysteine methyltransferase